MFVQVKGIPQRAVHSYRNSTIRCPKCKYEAANDVNQAPVILTRVHPKVHEIGMDRLVARALSGPDVDCPACTKEGRSVPMYRNLINDHIEYSDLLIVTVARYLLRNHIMFKFRTPLFFRYASDGTKVNTKIKNTDRVVYGIEDYELFGFTVHQGINTSSGHYFGYQTETSEKFDDHGGMKKDS